MLRLIMKIKTNTNMVDPHFLKKYIFIDFFHFLTKQFKKLILELAIQCYDGCLLIRLSVELQ